MELNRRDFLRIFGGAAGAAMLTGCELEEVFKFPDRLVKRATTGPKVELWKNTVCRLCPGGCGICVQLLDGIPVYVKGNPIHPINRGGMCPLGLNALHQLYNPDRLSSPMKVTGQGGNKKLDPVSWEEALRTVADTLGKLRREGKPHQVAFLGYDERGLMSDHIARFLHAYGSPNYYQFSFFQNDAAGLNLVHGHSQPLAYDFLNAKLIISFGANFLEEGYTPVYYTKLYSRHQEKGTRYIQIEPRCSLTASNADWWIPIRPGTYAALALGIAYVLIREELYDVEFMRNRTFGFDDWTDESGKKHQGFKNMVLGNYYPDVVSDITGVPSSTILELARDLENTRPALVLADNGAIDNTNGTFTLMAVQSLNALLSNYETIGGVYFVDQPPFADLPRIQQDEVARKGVRQIPIAQSRDAAYALSQFSIDSFAKNVLDQQPYPIDVLFLHRGNPLFQTLNHRDFAEALKKIPLVVSFDSMINETNEFAHLILPDHTFLEKWDEISNVPTVGFSHMSVQRPVVEPFYDTRHTGDVLIDIAKRVGGTVSASFPFSNYKEMMTIRARGVYESGKGAVISEGVQRMWMEYLQQRGWQIGRYTSFEEFWDLLIDRGGWWNPIRGQKPWHEIFQTPSKKFEFYSQKLKSTINQLTKRRGEKDVPYADELVLNRLNISARGDTVFLPHYEPVPYETDRPLYFISFQLLPTRDGTASDMPMMQEMFGSSTGMYWRSWAEIHPETAKLYGIADSDWIWVESSVGGLKVEAKLTPGIMPGVVAVPFGLGRTSGGRFAKGHGVNPHSIMRNLYDSLSGKPALEATKVRISRTT